MPAICGDVFARLPLLPLGEKGAEPELVEGEVG